MAPATWVTSASRSPTDVWRSAPRSAATARPPAGRRRAPTAPGLTSPSPRAPPPPAGRLQIYRAGLLDGEARGPTGDMSYADGRTTAYPNDPFLVLGAEKHDAGSAYPSFNGLIDVNSFSDQLG